MRRLVVGLLVAIAALVALPPLYYRVFPVPPSELPPAGRRIEVAPGVAVNAIERGDGSPAVLIHGLPGCAYDWTPLSEALAARGFRVLAYDRVGFGRSDPRPDDDFSVEANARELLALLRAEDLREVTLVGHSYGGGTAIRAARRDPSRIARLVLIGSAGPLDDPPDLPAGSAVLFSAPVLRWVAAVPPVAAALRQTLTREAYSQQPAPAWWLPQLAANFARPQTLSTWREEGARFRWDEHDPTAVERRILVIHGDDDRLVPPVVGEALHRLAPHSELWMVPSGSHMLPMTHVGPVADRIAAFARAAP